MAWKMEQQGRKLILVNPVTTAAGTMNHQTEKKESLSPGMEIRLVGGCPVDRRAYSAFLLQHVNPDTGTIDFQKCREDFPAFLHLSQQKIRKTPRWQDKTDENHRPDLGSTEISSG